MKTKHVLFTAFFLFTAFILSAQLKVRTDGSVQMAYSGYQNLYLGNYTSSGINNGQYGFEVSGSCLNIWKPWPSPYNNINRNNYLYITVMGGVGIGKIPGYSGRVLDIAGPAYAYGFFTVSDKRLKKDIAPLTDKTGLIYSLNGKSYKKYFLQEATALTVQKDANGNPVAAKTGSEVKADAREFTEFGFIAQELKEVYPELVSQDTLGYYSINYTGLIPLLVEAIKEQKTELESLKQVLNGGDGVGPKKAGAAVTSLNETDALSYPVLDQNVPNPFDVSTTISYYLPATIAGASIYIYDMNGVQLKSYPVVERGKGNIILRAHEFDAGMYLYALIADGKVIDTKRMILTK